MTNPTVKVENLLGMLTIRLKDDNFVKWAFQFKAVLKGYKLFGFFDGFKTDSRSKDALRWGARICPRQFQR